MSYLILDDGRVWSNLTDRWLTPSKTGSEYLRLWLAGGERVGVHRLVAQTFLPNPENKCCVNHKDGNKLNNHVSNLEWVSFGENTTHAMQTGLMSLPSNAPSGETHHSAKLTPDKVRFIRMWRKSGYSFTSIGEAFGVSYQTVQRIVERKTWKSVQDS